jgi:hypothetical protein
VTDVSLRDAETGREYPGRIELEAGTGLFGFSVTSRQLECLQRWADRHASADVAIEIDTSAPMPVVSGALEGRDGGREVWMTAHLCHPRPSANDNASGVAALLGVGAALASARAEDRSSAADRTIRFVWAPEFVGCAALLHSHTDPGRGGLWPLAAINLDMVGEDQASCGGPFLVERDPACRPSPIAPVAEHVVERVFATTPTPPGAWGAMAYAGSSDHALFADPKLDCAAVALRHAPDRFNHTAADSTDKVCAAEMRRAAAAAAALALVVAGGDAVSWPAVREVVSAWTTKELADARRVAHAHTGVDGGAWSRGLLRRAARQAAELLALAETPGTFGPPPGGEEQSEPGARPRVRGCWSGPLNLRAMIDGMPASGRAELSALIAADERNRAVLSNFAIRADGTRDREGIVADTSYALKRPIEAGIAARLLEALFESGWVVESEPEGSIGAGRQGVAEPPEGVAG